MSPEYYGRLQEMGLQGSFGHLLKGVMFFKMKAAESEEQNIPLNLCSSRGAGKMTFQNQPQDYVTI